MHPLQMSEDGRDTLDRTLSMVHEAVTAAMVVLLAILHSLLLLNVMACVYMVCGSRRAREASEAEPLLTPRETRFVRVASPAKADTKTAKRDTETEEDTKEA
jgi:hypothetical protein